MESKSQMLHQMLMDSFYEMCVDDGTGNSVIIKDRWMEERFVEAGLLESVEDNAEEIQYPRKVDEHMVFSRQRALNLDTLAASYSATLKNNNPLQADFTRGTVDSLYVPQSDRTGGKHVYLIEFKNGDWESNELYKKITDSLFLLNDLEAMDAKVVLKNNRSNKTYEADNLDLSGFYREYTGYDNSTDFYKYHATFLLVSSKGVNCFRKFSQLCLKKQDYRWMNEILQNVEFNILKKTSSKKNNFGYEYINKLAYMLLHAKSTNKYMLHYDNIIKFFERLENIKNKHRTCKKIIDLLKQYPLFFEYLKELMYKDYDLYDKNYNYFVSLGYSKEESFLCVAAVCSVQPYKGNYLSDDYNVLCQLGKSICSTNKSKFKEKIEMFVKVANDCKISLQGLFVQDMRDEDFMQLVALLDKEQYSEVVKRVILYQRVIEAHQMGLSQECGNGVFRLLCSIFHIEQKLQSEIRPYMERLCKEQSDFIIILSAILAYIQEDKNIRKRIDGGAYVHMVRQLEYLRDMYCNDRDNRFGRFAEPLENYFERNLSEKQGLSFEQIKGKIIKGICEGKSIQELFPVFYAGQKTIEDVERKLKTLKTKVKGTILYDVQGCKAVDFLW